MSYPPHTPPPNNPPPNSGIPGGHNGQPHSNLPNGHTAPGSPSGYGHGAAPFNQGQGATGGPGASHSANPYGHNPQANYPSPGYPGGPSPRPGQEPKKSKAGIIVAIIVAIVVIGGAIAGGIYIFGKDKDKPISRAEYDEAIKGIFLEAGGGTGVLNDKQIDELIKCVGDKTYDKLSDEELKKVAAKEPFSSPLLQESGNVCIEDLFGHLDTDPQTNGDSEDTNSSDTQAEVDTSHPEGGITKEQYQQGLYAILESGADEGLWTVEEAVPLSECIADESYEHVSEQVRESIAVGIDVDDEVLFNAGVTCGQRLRAETDGGN